MPQISASLPVALVGKVREITGSVAKVIITKSYDLNMVGQLATYDFGSLAEYTEPEWLLVKDGYGYSYVIPYAKKTAFWEWVRNRTPEQEKTPSWVQCVNGQEVIFKEFRLK